MDQFKVGTDNNLPSFLFFEIYLYCSLYLTFSGNEVSFLLWVNFSTAYGITGCHIFIQN